MTAMRVVLLVLLAAVPAAAQGQASRGELFAGVGAARVGGDEGSRGNGPAVLGGLGVRVAPRVSIELDVMRATHERDLAGGPLEGTATGAFGSVVYQVSRGRAQAFVMGSAGVLRSETTHTYPVGGRPTTFRSDDSSFAWGGGGGVKLFVAPRLSLRPQVRMVFSESTGTMGLATASVGIGYHW